MWCHRNRNVGFSSIYSTFYISSAISYMMSTKGCYRFKLLSVKDNSGQMHLTAAVRRNWNGLYSLLLHFRFQKFRRFDNLIWRLEIKSPVIITETSTFRESEKQLKTETVLRRLCSMFCVRINYKIFLKDYVSLKTKYLKVRNPKWVALSAYFAKICRLWEPKCSSPEFRGRELQVQFIFFAAKSFLSWHSRANFRGRKRGQLNYFFDRSKLNNFGLKIQFFWPFLFLWFFAEKKSVDIWQ